MHVNSPAWADENQLKGEKVRFFSEMNDINSRWVIFNLKYEHFFKTADIKVIVSFFIAIIFTHSQISMIITIHLMYSEAMRYFLTKKKISKELLNHKDICVLFETV